MGLKEPCFSAYLSVPLQYGKTNLACIAVFARIKFQSQYSKDESEEICAEETFLPSGILYSNHGMWKSGALPSTHPPLRG